MNEPSKQTDEPLLISEGDAARRLGVSARTLWQLRQQGEIPHVRILNRVLYDPNDLPQWIEAQKRRADRRQADDQPQSNGIPVILPTDSVNVTRHV